MIAGFLLLHPQKYALAGRTLCGTILDVGGEAVLTVVFFRTSSGREPVREWLKELESDDRKSIGEDIKLIQYRWPMGMPLVRKLESDLWEVRTRLVAGRISRVFFTVTGDQMALLHGIVKKSQKTPSNDLNLARGRRDLWRSEEDSNESKSL